MTNTVSEQGDPRPVPAWLAVTIAVLCVAGGIALLWWYFRAPPRSIVIPGTNPPAAVAQASGGDENWTDDVRPRGPDQWNVRAGTVGFSVNKRDNKTNFVTYFRPDIRTDADRLVGRLLDRLGRPEAVKQIGLNEEQVKKLQAIPRVRGWVVQPDAMERVRQAWTAFESANNDAKANAKTALLAVVKEVGTACIDPTKARNAEQTAAANAVLTPEQLEKLKALK